VSWVYRFDDRALKELNKLGRPAQEKILAYLDDRIAGEEDPRRFGEALKANLAGLWRYRIGDYRLICIIGDEEMIILVLTAGHRKDVYE
jgi:mRNA interferase RelE/StbE